MRRYTIIVCTLITLTLQEIENKAQAIPTTIFSTKKTCQILRDETVDTKLCIVPEEQSDSKSIKLQEYFLEEQEPKANSSSSELIWEQDNQLYTVLLKNQSHEDILAIANSMVEAIPISSMATTPPKPVKNVLEIRHPMLTTAEQLREGEIVTDIRYRQSFPPGTGRGIGLTGQPTVGISWGVTNNLELKIDAQTVDNSGPAYQGAFDATRVNRESSPNFFQEITLQAKQRLWQNEQGTQALSGVIGVSRGGGGRPYSFGDGTGFLSSGRGYQFAFRDKTGIVASGENNQLAFSLELPFTIKPDDRFSFTISPKIAFLQENNALYYNTVPVKNPGSFGTNFGLATGVSYQFNPRLVLWGDTFIPFTGNNSISRDSGFPARTVAFNVGLRYIVNPRLATDIFISNTLGNTGALSVVTDRQFPSLGIGLTFLPGVTSANRRYPEHFGSTQQPPTNVYAGFGSLDGGTVPKNQLLMTLQGGSQGLLPGIRYGLLDDLEIGSFLESIPGTVDESQFGFTGKLRFLNQADGAPFTLSTALTFARSNNVIVNLTNGDRNAFQRLGVNKGGFPFSNETVESFITTLSVPMHYQFKGGSAIWLTPTLGYVQRSGVEIAGFNFGGSVPIFKDFDAIAEAGLEVSGKGNAFIGNNRETVIPWTVGFRWNPANFLGISDSGLRLEAYFTNRLGTSPFDSLRVRADNETAIGFGLLLPIQF